MTVLDKQLFDETREELSKGWAEEPFGLDDLEDGGTISRRFPLVQDSQTRMIDGFSIGGVNDSCSTFNEIDLHMVDTFASVVRQFFENSGKSGFSCLHEEKVGGADLPFEDPAIWCYFCIYGFLRLCRMLHWIAVKGLKLITTNFYVVFTLASPPSLSLPGWASLWLLSALSTLSSLRQAKIH